MKIMAVDPLTGDVLVGTMAGGAAGVVRIVDFTRSIDPRKPWEQSGETEESLDVEAEFVEPLEF
jgi:hypothetical protein